MYLDIKNMEYKNIDDSPAPSGGGEGGKEGGQERQEQQQEEQQQEIAIDEEVKEEFRQGALMGTQSHVLGYGTSVKPGHLFINGLPKPVTGTIFNVFDILKCLREEVQRLTALSSLPTSPSVQKQVVRLAATAGAAAAAEDGEE
eukprot:evm.model.NODE_36271_length_3732_cov_18.737675.1